VVGLGRYLAWEISIHGIAVRGNHHRHHYTEPVSGILTKPDSCQSRKAKEEEICFPYSKAKRQMKIKNTQVAPSRRLKSLS